MSLQLRRIIANKNGEDSVTLTMKEVDHYISILNQHNEQIERALKIMNEDQVAEFLGEDNDTTIDPAVSPVDT
tara:strand:+ start:7419 stop:7637 length:219 start_codon:yes stop_codon:yes gene_type:complete